MFTKPLRFCAGRYAQLGSCRDIASRKEYQFMNKFVVILIGSILFCSCNNTTMETKGELSVNTDKDLYSINEPVSITLHNGTKSTAYFVHCNYRLGFFIEQETNNSWSEKSSVAILCLGIYPMGIKAVEPGDMNKDSIILRQSGVYRIKHFFSWQDTISTSDSLLSNKFTVQ